MTVQITPSILKGTVTAIPSKSELHRALICASFCEDPTDIIVPGSAYAYIDIIPDDIKATVSCLCALGAEISFVPNMFHVRPLSSRAYRPEMDCRESASTLRFMLPVAAASSLNASFTGGEHLSERPISDLLITLEEHGVTSSAKGLPLELSGNLSDGRFYISGNVTSQYLSGLLLTLPLLDSGSDIVLSTELRSSSYIDITVDIMSKFGVNVIRDGDRYYLSGPVRYRSPGTVTIGGDWSNASAFLVAGLLNGCNSVAVKNLEVSSPQGDKNIIHILESFGAHLKTSSGGILSEGARLHGAAIDIDSNPDLMPSLAVAAMAADGNTEFVNAERQRYKESDRIISIERMVCSLNCQARSSPDSLVISGGSDIRGGTIDSFGDHRIVMAAAIASCLTDTPVTVTNAESVSKSYPTFFDDFRSIGGIVNVI